MTPYVARAAYKMPRDIFFLSSSFFTLPLLTRPNTSPRVNLFVDSRAQSLLRTPLPLPSSCFSIEDKGGSPERLPKVFTNATCG